MPADSSRPRVRILSPNSAALSADFPSVPPCVFLPPLPFPLVLPFRLSLLWYLPIHARLILIPGQSAQQFVPSRPTRGGAHPLPGVRAVQSAWFRIKLQASGLDPPAVVEPNGWQESQATWLLDPQVAREEKRLGRETVHRGLSAATTEDAETQGGTKALSLPGWGEEAVNATERRAPLALRILSERSRRSTPAWPGSYRSRWPSLCSLGCTRSLVRWGSFARTRQEKPFVS